MVVEGHAITVTAAKWTVLANMEEIE